MSTKYTLPKSNIGVISEIRTRWFRIEYGANQFYCVFYGDQVVVIPRNFTSTERDIVKQIYGNPSFRNANKIQNIINHIDEAFADFVVNSDWKEYAKSYVCNQFKNNKEVSTFLIELATKGVEDRFDPFPSCCLNFPEYGSNSLHSKENFSFMGNYRNTKFMDWEPIRAFNKKYSSLKDVKDLAKMIQGMNTDDEIINEIGLINYELISFYLQSNQLELRHANLTTRSDIETMSGKNYSYSRGDVNKFIHGFDQITQFEIEHPRNKEQSFNEDVKKNGNIFLFHGSGYGNWYSICRNGVKNMSGTKYMSAGQAYGQGIYLSNDLNLSKGYTGHNSGGSARSIVAVFEVVGDGSNYKKSGNIFVCPDDDKLLLRYLLCFPSNSSVSGTMMIQFFNLKFGTNIKKDKAKASATATKLNNKRLFNEYQKLSKQIERGDMNFRIEIPDESNFNLWNVYIDQITSNTLLVADMKKYGVKHIKAEFRFNGYPFRPPFVRIVHPRFMRQTGHITIGGSICTQLLADLKEGWKPCIGVETVIRELEFLLGDTEGVDGKDGRARLDPTQWNVPYTLSEAQDAFNRIAVSYGWAK